MSALLMAPILDRRSAVDLEVLVLMQMYQSGLVDHYAINRVRWYVEYIAKRQCFTVNLPRDGHDDCAICRGDEELNVLLLRSRVSVAHDHCRTVIDARRQTACLRFRRRARVWFNREQAARVNFRQRSRAWFARREVCRCTARDGVRS